MAVLRRVGLGLIVVWLAVTLAFIALRALPGDSVAAQLLGTGAIQADVAARRSALGLDQPLIVQYGRYLAGLVRGDMGESLVTGLPVTEMIAQVLPSTVLLAASALAVAVVAGIGLGVVAALDLEPGVSALAGFVINVSLSTPIYWTGTLAIYVFTVQLDLLPSSGGGRLSNLIMPAAVLGFHTAGAIGRVVQTSVRDTRRADFVRTARAKGLTETAILSRHVLRAALLPTVTVIALQAGFLLGGTVITESLFGRPGMGRVLLDATLRQDYPVVQGVVVLAALIYTALNTTTDVFYRLLDPRVTL